MMTPEAFANRSRLVLIGLNNLKRAALSQILSSSFYRWRYNRRAAEQFLLIPPDLRTSDPSFGTEVYHGHFGLAGAVAVTNNSSPFAIRPPNMIWEEELHGFGWLRHFTAAPNEQAKSQVKALVKDWIYYSKRQPKVAYLPHIVSRRMISWLSHIGHHMDESDTAFYDSVMRSLNQQIHYLSDYYAQIPDGYPRLTSLIALVFAGLCLAEQESFTDDYLEILCSELDRQIYEDGGHFSRNPWVLVELVLDLLPLKQSFISHNREPPTEILQAINRILPTLRFMRLGDGYLARFNGMSATLPDALATVLSYDDTRRTESGVLAQSGYCRLAIGPTHLLMDCGRPPELIFSSQAHAGTLSFEMSVGSYPLIVNCGAPGPANQNWRLTSRTTPSHSTLSIRKNSSSQLLKNGFLNRYLDGPLLYGPDTVTHTFKDDENSTSIEASHNGFEDNHSIVYKRKLTLSENGHRLEGQEHLLPAPKAKDLASKRFPFAVHFHIHPDVNAVLSKDKKTVILELPNSETWKFISNGIMPSLEESLFFADFRGPRRTIQIVLRGIYKGKMDFSWVVEKIHLPHKEDLSPEALQFIKSSRLTQTQQRLIFQNSSEETHKPPAEEDE